MTANYSAISKKERERIKKEVGKELQRQSSDLMRRFFKILCLVLNDDHGFGKVRLQRTIQKISRLSTERENDEAFWQHIDVRMRQIGLLFDQEDYKEMDDGYHARV